MAVPKRRHSTGRKGRRRAAIKLNLPRLVSCPICNQPKKTHLVCPSCGQYQKNDEDPSRSKAHQKKKSN